MPSGTWLQKPALRHIKGKRHVVTEEGRYLAADGRIFVIPVGFETDGGSVPRPLWWWMPPFGDDAECAYVLHDFLYRYAEQFMGSDNGHMSRGEADGLLKEAARAATYHTARSAVVYSGVRTGGWRSWNRYRKLARDYPAGV